MIQSQAGIAQPNNDYCTEGMGLGPSWLVITATLPADGLLGSSFMGENDVLWMLLAMVQAEPVKAPPYYTAQERWKCSFPGFVGKADVTEYFGIFRSHVESVWGSDYTLAQNDAAAVVFIASDYGETDMSGKTLHYASVDMIDKKSRRFKRTVLDINSKPDERIGECQPY